jgi:hypothetical protein
MKYIADIVHLMEDDTTVTDKMLLKAVRRAHPYVVAIDHVHHGRYVVVEQYGPVRLVLDVWIAGKAPHHHVLATYRNIRIALDVVQQGRRLTPEKARELTARIVAAGVDLTGLTPEDEAYMQAALAEEE